MIQGQNLFIEFHVLRSYAPGNLNRDELGTPKSALFGGSRRLRISSQCLKRTWRTSPYFTGDIAKQHLGVRTATLPEMVREHLEKEGARPESLAGMNVLLRMVGRKNTEASDDDEKTAHLLFLSQDEIDAVYAFARKHAAELARIAPAAAVATTVESEPAPEAKSKGRKKSPAKSSGDDDARKKLADELKKAFIEHLAAQAPRNAVDVALFGRFVTSDEFKTVNAAMQVAHALGTQKVEIEYDYFSAVDDRAQTTGAGHIGEAEFASSVFYQYAVCDWRTLKDNLRGDGALAARAMRALAHAMAREVPKGKKNGTAPQNPADYLEVVVRRDAPISLTNAYSQPVTDKHGDVMDESIRLLRKHSSRYEEAYSAPDDVLGRFVLSLRDLPGDEPRKETRTKTLRALAEGVEGLLLAERAG